MAKTPAQQIKQSIVDDLQSLVTGGVLGSVATDDFTKLNPLDRTWGNFPAALVIPPTVGASEYLDTATNVREYTWYVMIITTPDNLPENDPTYLESLIDQTLQVFDNDVTLQGVANGGVQPAVLDPPGPVSAGALTYVMFTVTLKAKVVVTSAVQ